MSVVVKPLSEAPDQIAIVGRAMEELAIYQALVIVHGADRAPKRYVDAGGHVRQGPDGEVLVFFEGVWWRLDEAHPETKP